METIVGRPRSELVLFHNDYEWIFAWDKDHLRQEYEAYIGSKVPDDEWVEMEWEEMEWEEWKGKLKIYLTEDRSGPFEEHTPQKWAELQGPGFLCSTEF